MSRNEENNRFLCGAIRRERETVYFVYHATKGKISNEESSAARYDDILAQGDDIFSAGATTVGYTLHDYKPYMKSAKKYIQTDISYPIHIDQVAYNISHYPMF